MPRWKDDFLLSGMDILGQRTVWRLTAHNTTAVTSSAGVVSARPVSVCIGAGVSSCVPTSCSLTFPEGSLRPSGNWTSGYWIVQPHGGRPSRVRLFFSDSPKQKFKSDFFLRWPRKRIQTVQRVSSKYERVHLIQDSTIRTYVGEDQRLKD